MPMKITPMPPWSKISRTCSSAAIFKRSASSIMIKVVGSGAPRASDGTPHSLAIREPRPFLDGFGKPIFFREDRPLVGGFLLLQLLALHVLFPSEGSGEWCANAQALDIVRNVPRGVHHLGGVEQRIAPETSWRAASDALP